MIMRNDPSMSAQDYIPYRTSPLELDTVTYEYYDVFQ